MSSGIANEIPIDIPVEQQGTVTSLRRMPRSTSTRLVLNRKVTVVVPKGVSEYFAGLQVIVRGVWKHGARHRYLLASTIEPVETPADWTVERLSRALLGPTPATGEQTAVLTVLAPALSWLLTARLGKLATRLAQVSLRKAEHIAANPYLLVKRRELDFESADMVHRRTHGDPWLLSRLQAATTEVLRRAERAGCARLTREDLIGRLTALLALDGDQEVDWECVWRSSLVARDGERYCLPSWFYVRRRVLQQFQNNQLTLGAGAVPGYETILAHRYSVITGAAMSGKTSLVRDLAGRCREAGWRVAVTAMTGKAASVLGPEAMTIHRLIGYGPKGCSKQPLPYDLILIDEISMCTYPLLASVMQIAKGHVVFCGDPRQLPPVEGEPVFQDLMKVLPVHDLGIRPTVEVETVRHWSLEHLLANLERLCRNCEAEGREWQVLSPVRRSALGTERLNLFLQRVVNEHGTPVGDGFRIGDRVLVVRNDYRGPIPVYNGQTGKVIGAGETALRVQFDGGEAVEVSSRDLELAHCLTVRKAQGSRYDTVVFVVPPVAKEFAEDIHMQYVGLTRGRRATLCYAL